MIALRCTDDGPFLDRQAPVPEPGPGEALVQPSAVLITPTDLAAVRRDIAFAGVLGHVCVGRVTAVNDPSGAGESWAGRRVTIQPSIVDPGADLARRGLGEHDPGRRILGLRGADGCLAGRVVVPIRNLVAVDDGLPDERILLAHELAPVTSAVRLADAPANAYVTVLGDTLGGLLCAQLAADANAAVRLIALGDERFGLLERWGVRHRLVEEIGLRQDQAAVIECTGEAAQVGAALRMIRPRGTVVLMSNEVPVPGERPHEPGGPGLAVDLSRAILHEATLVGVRTGSLAEGLRAAMRPELDIDGLITRRFTLEQSMEALRAASSPTNIAVVVEVRG